MNNIQKLREEKGLSVNELTQKLGISRTTLYNYESDINPIPSNVLIDLAKIFEVSTDYILGLSSDRYNYNEELSSEIDTIMSEIVHVLYSIETVSKKTKKSNK